MSWVVALLVLIPPQSSYSSSVILCSGWGVVYQRLSLKVWSTLSFSLYRISERVSCHILALPPSSRSAVICYLVPPNLVLGAGGGRGCFLWFWFSHRQLLCWGLLGISDPEVGGNGLDLEHFPVSFPTSGLFLAPSSSFIQSAYGFCSVAEKDSDGASGLSWSNCCFSLLNLHHKGGLFWFLTLPPHFLLSTGKVSREESASGYRFLWFCGSQEFYTPMVAHLWLLEIC